MWPQPLLTGWDTPAAEFPAPMTHPKTQRQVSPSDSATQRPGPKGSSEQLLASTSFSPEPPPSPGAEDYEALNLPLIEKYPELSGFVKHVSDGQNDVVRGVYAPGVFALPVIQQPKNRATYVSNKRARVTQFSKAAENGVVGLLAHNYLSGGLFYGLKPGQEVIVVLGDGRLHTYRVTSIRQYQKLSPSDPHSPYLDLRSGQTFSATQIFEEYYQGKPQLVFQTCLESRGILNWGLTFITAEPVTPRSQ
ncbi:MAG TPA: hypothetical protein PKE64_13270 [Anaerolineae bacterium]|nr:hypothetical protein [Anaerolineae bacterium]HMR64973.1 hypothetical protein [Anaerolineae bacterium]